MSNLRSSGRVLPRRTAKSEIELFDSRTGNLFYFDRETRSYAWEKPSHFDSVWLRLQKIGDLVRRSEEVKVIGDAGLEDDERRRDRDGLLFPQD